MDVFSRILTMTVNNTSSISTFLQLWRQHLIKYTNENFLKILLKYSHWKVCFPLCCCHTHSHAQLCDPMDCSPPGSSVHRTSQQEFWSELPFPTPQIFLTQGSNLHVISWGRGCNHIHKWQGHWPQENNVYRGSGNQHLFKPYSKPQNGFNSEKDVPKNTCEKESHSKKCWPDTLMIKWLCIRDHTRNKRRGGVLGQHNEVLLRELSTSGLESCATAWRIYPSFVFFYPSKYTSVHLPSAPENVRGMKKVIWDPLKKLLGYLHFFPLMLQKNGLQIAESQWAKSKNSSVEVCTLQSTVRFILQSQGPVVRQHNPQLSWSSCQANLPKARTLVLNFKTQVLCT